MKTLRNPRYRIRGRLLAVAVLTVVMALVAAGCSSDDGTSEVNERVAELESALEAELSKESQDADRISELEAELEAQQAELEAQQAPPDTTGDDQITLDVWSHEFQPLQDALIQKWAPEFEALHPNVKIKVTSIPFAGVVSYDAQLLTALSSGGGPDLWDMGDWSYKPILENGWITALDPTIFGYEDNQELIDAYQPGSLGILEDGGELYGLFSEFNTLAMFYNKDLMDEIGVEIPTDRPLSWDEIGEISANLRVEDASGILERIGYQFGFFANFRSPQWYAMNFYTIMRQYGQNDLYVNGEPAADTEAVKNAFQVFYDFTYEYLAYDPTFLSNFFADIPQGRAAMVTAGTWYPGAASPNAPDGDFNYAVAPHPVVDPDDPATYHNIAWLWGWSVNSNSTSEEQQAAQEFMAFMLGKKGETEQAAWWFDNLGYLQPSTAFLDSDAYGAAVEENPWLMLFIDALDTYSVLPVQHSYDEAGSALVRAMDRVVYDGATAEEAAASLQTELLRLGG